MLASATQLLSSYFNFLNHRAAVCSDFSLNKSHKIKSNIILNEVITSEMTEIKVVKVLIVKVSIVEILIEEVSAEDEVVNSSKVQVKTYNYKNDAINDVEKIKPLKKTILESSS